MFIMMEYGCRYHFPWASPSAPFLVLSFLYMIGQVQICLHGFERRLHDDVSARCPPILMKEMKERHSCSMGNFCRMKRWVSSRCICQNMVNCLVRLIVARIEGAHYLLAH